MKNRLFLLLILIFVNFSFANESLENALTNGKFSGDFRSYYFSKTYEHTYKNADIWVNGIYLRYKSASFKGFSLGSTTLFTTKTFENDPDNRFYYTMDTEGYRLSEFYLEYLKNKTNIKIGRQYIDTPLVKSNDSRLVKQAFHGVVLENVNISKSKIQLAYLNKFQDRTNSQGDIGEFEKKGLGNKGTWSLYFATQALKNTIIQTQYVKVSEAIKNSKDSFDIIFSEVRYNFEAEYKPFLIAQYLTTLYEKNNLEDGKSFGVVLGGTFSGLYGYIAFNKVTKHNSVKQGIGGATALNTNGHNYDAWSSTLANTNAFKTKFEYQINKLRLKASYALFKKKGFKDVSETNLSIHYELRNDIKIEIQHSLFNNEYLLDPGIDSLLITRFIYSF